MGYSALFAEGSVFRRRRQASCAALTKHSLLSSHRLVLNQRHVKNLLTVVYFHCLQLWWTEWKNSGSGDLSRLCTSRSERSHETNDAWTDCKWKLMLACGKLHWWNDLADCFVTKEIDVLLKLFSAHCHSSSVNNVISSEYWTSFTRLFTLIGTLPCPGESSVISPWK